MQYLEIESSVLLPYQISSLALNACADMENVKWQAKKSPLSPAGLSR